jgi:predicted nucleic acid-binding protein
VTLYAETSAVLRWLFNEPQGDAVLDRMRRASKVVSSRLTLVEARRAIRRASREAGLASAGRAEVLSALALAAARWALLDLSRSVVERAEGEFPIEPIRTLDALHLASALVLRDALPDLVVLSTDDRLRANALELGFAVLPA